MSIQSEVKELKALRQEIKALSKKTSEMRKRAKVLETHITEFLTAKGQPGVKFEGENIFLLEKETHARKKATESRQSTLELLQAYRVQNPEKLLEELALAKKGPKITVRTLKTSKVGATPKSK